MEKNLQIRKELVSSCKRIVIKAGTRLLTDPEALALLKNEVFTDLIPPMCPGLLKVGMICTP